MFGLFRLLLASFVAATHVGKLPASAGGYAVLSFYMLSGYLMTLVLNRSYFGEQHGIRRFYINRVLRIFPPLCFVTAVTALTLSFLPHEKPAAFSVMQLPETYAAWLINISLVGYISIDGRISPIVSSTQLVPVAWSISVEWVFYIVIPFIAAHKRLVASLFALSLAYASICAYLDMPYEMRYNSPLAAALPFSIGSLLYFFEPSIPRHSRLVLVVVTIAVYIVHSIQRHLYDGYVYGGMYVSLVLSAIVIGTLKSYEPSSRKLQSVDNRLGSISYAVFLTHYWVGLCVVSLFPSIRAGSNAHLFTTLPLVYIAAFCIERYIEAPLSSWRDTVRGVPR